MMPRGRVLDLESEVPTQNVEFHNDEKFELKTEQMKEKKTNKRRKERNHVRKKRMTKNGRKRIMERRNLTQKLTTEPKQRYKE